MANKTAGDGHTYIGRELYLRKKETEAFMREIGFVSTRQNDRWLKREVKARSQHNVVPLVLEDTIVEKFPVEGEMDQWGYPCKSLRVCPTRKSEAVHQLDFDF